MKAIIEDKTHEIIYIDYSGNGIPHSVVTRFWVDTAKVPYWRPVFWDFFLEQNDIKDIRAYESGSGGNGSTVQAPQWVDGFTGRYWMAEGIEFEGEPINDKRLKFPKFLKGYWANSRNPMKVAEIVYGYTYCDRCNNDHTEMCYEHLYCDDHGDLRYKDDHSYAE